MFENSHHFCYYVDVSSIDFECTELIVFTFPSVSECNGCRKVKCSQVLSYDGTINMVRRIIKSVYMTH